MSYIQAIKRANVWSAIGNALRTEWKIALRNWKNNLQARREVGIDESWRLELASMATIEPNSEAAETGESLWARSPCEVVQGV